MKRLHLGFVCALSIIFTGCSATSNSNQTSLVTNTQPSSAVNSNVAPVAAPANTNSAAAADNANVALASAEDFTTTRALYAQHCTACHGAGGEGQNMGSMKIPSLKSTATVAHTDAELNNFITNGEIDEGMPAFKGKLSKSQIETMVRYIRTEIQGKGAKGSGNAKAAS